MLNKEECSLSRKIFSTVVAEDIRSLVHDHGLPWEELSGKTLLITGANGFLSLYIIKTLLYLNDAAIVKQPVQVIGLVRNLQKAKDKLGEIMHRADFQLIVQDVCDSIVCKYPINYIIHAASQASPKYFGRDPVGTLSANLIGTINCLKLAEEKKVQGFLYFSSGEVYGNPPPEQIPTPETFVGHIDSLDVRSCYAESKRMAETSCVSWLHQFNIPVKIVRPFHTYGPGMDLDDGRVFADFVADIVNRRNIKLNSDGFARRSFCYLADATAGFFTVLFYGECGEAYNIGNQDAEISIGELANKLVALYSNIDIKVVKDNKPFEEGYMPSRIHRSSPNIDKIQALGWHPLYNIEVGFERTVRSFLE